MLLGSELLLREIFLTMHRILFLLLLLTACTAREPQVYPTLVPFPEAYQALPYGETMSGNLTESNNVGLWTFEGIEGERIRIRAIKRGAAVSLKLAQGANVISEGSDTIELTLPYGGSYFLTVYLVGGAGQYDIGLGYTNRPNPNEATPLPQLVGVPTPTPAYSNLGEFIREFTASAETGSILSDYSPSHVYTLEANASDIINFELYRMAGTLDPVLRLYDPDGNLMTMDDNSLGELNARLFNITLPEDGLYSLQVDGKGLFGDYMLIYTDHALPVEVEPIPTIAPTLIAPYATAVMQVAAPDQHLMSHQPMLSSIARSGDFQRYSFYAQQGQVISLMIAPFEGQEIQPQFEIFNPIGEQVVIAQSSSSEIEGTAAVFALPIAETGVYIVIVTAEENTIGRFSIFYGNGASFLDDYQGQLASGNTQAQITERGLRHVWQVNVDPGDVISVAARPNDARFDPYLELVTADGTVVYQDDNSAGNRAAALELAAIYEPATYLLRVSDAKGEIGGYTLEWHYVNIAATATPIPIWAKILAASDSLELGQYGFYTFQARAGQLLRIAVLANESSSFDPVAALLDPNGEIIVEADDSEGSLNPVFFFTVQETGTYTLRVNGYLSGGQFDVIIVLVLD
jgi:hypothetical protein